MNERKCIPRTWQILPQCYERALEIDPDYILLSDKGDSLYRLGKYRDAIQCYERALGIDPDCVNALSGKGHSLEALGKHQDAAQYREKALATDTDAFSALYGKGDVYSRHASSCSRTLR